MDSLKNLLPGAISRAKITRQVATAQVAAAADEYLRLALPPGHQNDAHCLYLRDGRLTIGGVNGSVISFLRLRENELLAHIKSREPRALIAAVHFIVTGPESDVVEY